MISYIRLLILSSITALLVVPVFSPVADAGMVWGFHGDLRGVATTAHDDIYLSTTNGAYKITTNNTMPVAYLEVSGGFDHKPIAASNDGSHVAIAACAECSESDRDYDRLIITDGRLQLLHTIKMDVMPGRAWSAPTLQFSDDGSRIYVHAQDAVVAIHVSEATVAWSMPCEGTYGRVLSMAYAPLSDRIGYVCYANNGPGAIVSTVAILDGRSGIPLWNIALPDFAYMSMSPSGHWIQVWGSTLPPRIYEFPSVVPDVTWDEGMVLFLSDDDRFVHVKSEEVDGPQEYQTTFDWFAAPLYEALPEPLSTKTFDGLPSSMALSQGNQFIVIHDDPSAPAIPHWEHYRYEDGPSYMQTHTLKFSRYGHDGQLLEAGNSSPSSPDSIVPVSDSLRAILFDSGSHITFFEADAENNMPVFGDPPCHWDDDVVTVDVTDPDGDEMSVFWNFSRGPFNVVDDPLWPNLVDATGNVITVPEDVNRNRVIALVEDEHGALSPSRCGPTNSDDSPDGREAHGLSTVLVFSGFVFSILVAKYARFVQRPRT